MMLTRTFPAHGCSMYVVVYGPGPLININMYYVRGVALGLHNFIHSTLLMLGNNKAWAQTFICEVKRLLNITIDGMCV